MEDLSNLWLIINIILWLSTFIWYRKHFSYFGAGGVLLLSFLIYAVLSTLLYNDKYWGEEFHQLTLFPFIYLYAMILLSIYPVFHWDKLPVQRIETLDEKAVLIVSWFFVFCTILRVGDFGNLYQGLITMIVSSNAGHNVYLETLEQNQQNVGDESIRNIFAIFSNMLYDFSIVFLFYFLSRKHKRIRLIIALIISIVISIILPIAESQRGPVLEKLLTVLIIYFAMKRFLAKNIIKKVNKILMSLGAIISLPVVFITISRFNDRGTLGSLFSYFGQENLFFNNYAFDNNGLRWGDRIFPLFKKILFIDGVPDGYYARRIKYSYLHINDDVFIGYVGDFLLDFGPIIPIFIFAFYSKLTSSCLHAYDGKIYIYQILPLIMLLHISLFGGLCLFPLADMGNLMIFFYFIMFFYLKYFKFTV